jgi:hypothetical protein
MAYSVYHCNVVLVIIHSIMLSIVVGSVGSTSGEAATTASLKYFPRQEALCQYKVVIRANHEFLYVMSFTGPYLRSLAHAHSLLRVAALVDGRPSGMILLLSLIRLSK